MRALVAALVMVAALWAGAVPAAAWEPPPWRTVVDQHGPQWAVDRALATANKTWHSPCGGAPTIEWAPMVGAHAIAWPATCTIWVNVAERFDRRAFCHMLVHEVGHLANAIYPDNVAAPWHSPNRNSVMYGGMFSRTDPDDVVVLPRRVTYKRCRKL